MDVTSLLLLDCCLQGADPWITDNLGGRSALHYATRINHPHIMELLILAAGASGPVSFPNRPDTK